VRHRSLVVVGFLASTLIANRASAQTPPAEPDTTALAKATQNPVGDLTAVPLQFNFNSGGDLVDQTFFNLNFQPVVPFRVGQWNIIARTIVPINSMPAGADTRVSGVGDIQEQIYVSPAKVGKVIWGVGPVFSFPTATASALKTGTWAGGFGAVVLAMPGPWVIGGLVNQYWPMSDVGDAPKTDLFVFQPFVNYNFGKGYAIAFAPLISANWDAPDGNQWTVPLGLGITRTTVFNGRPMSLGVQYYDNVERPSGSAGQQLKFVVSFLYPRGPRP
jgi:hypothetical protein